MNGNSIPKIEELFDGYDLDGYIAAVPGVHDGLSFKYRPIDPLTSRRLAVKKSVIVNNKGLSDEDKELLCEMATIEMVCGNILSWELDSQPSVAAVLRHFPDYRYTRLMQIVIGGLASDPKPNADPSAPPERDTGDLGAAEKN